MRAPEEKTKEAGAPAQGVLAGIFVGGESRRMGRAKGLFMAPGAGGHNLVERLHSELTRVAKQTPCVLVGARPEYAHLPFATIEDAQEKSGPLGGLVSLLMEAEKRGAKSVLVLACDFPYLSGELMGRLLGMPLEEVSCAHLDGRFQPLFARYSLAVLPRFSQALHEGRLALQPLLRESQVALLTLSEEEKLLLRDWDTPEDVGLEPRFGSVPH